MELLKFIKSYMKKQWPLFILNILFSICFVFIDIINVDILRNMTENALDGKTSKIIEFVILFAIILVIHIIFNILSTISTTKFNLETSNCLKKRFAQKVLRAPYHDNSKQFVSKLNNEITSIANFIGQLKEYIAVPLLICAYITYLAFLNWKLLLISIFCLPVLYFISVKISKKFDKNFDKMYQHIEESNVVLQDMMNGIATIKAYNYEHNILRRYREKLLLTYQDVKGIEKRNIVNLSVRILLNELPPLLLIVGGSILALNEMVSVPEVVVFVQSIHLLIDRCLSLPQLIKNYRESKVTISRVKQILEQDEERKGGRLLDNVEYIDKIIELKGVNYFYGEKQVLHNIQFTFKKGKKYLIIGKNGSGKSTLLKLLYTLYSTNQGQINYYGIPRSEINMVALREKIVLISQDHCFMDDSVEMNISFKEIRNEKRLMSACRRANFLQEIEKMPEGFQTELTDNAIHLSSGQKQRLSLARALYKDSEIILMDEPFSSLDLNNIYQIRDIIKEMKDKTIIITMHTPELIDDVDTVIVMDHGNIVDIGNINELSKKVKIVKAFQKNRRI